jgi:hypothetical protein
MLQITAGEAEAALPEAGTAGPAEGQIPGPDLAAEEEAAEALPAAQTVDRVRRNGLPQAGPADHRLHGKHGLLRPAEEAGPLLPNHRRHHPHRAEDGQAVPHHHHH